MRSGSISYDVVADRYEESRGGRERAVQLAAGILPWLAGGGLVADVGAGTGIVTAELRAAGLDLVAVDLSPAMLVRAADRLPGRVAVGNAGHLPMRDGSLDAVTFVWVLHHVADVGVVLGEARRVLRPGGRVVAVSGLSRPIADEIGPIFEALNHTLRPERVDQAEAVASAGPAVGLGVVDQVVVRMSFRTSPADVAAAIRGRDFSHLWDVDDATWRATVDPAIDALLALPEPDRPRRRVAEHPLVVLERPAA